MILPSRIVLPSSLSNISAYQFWLVFRIGKIQSRRGRELTSASGGAPRAPAYLTESVVERVVPRMLIPASFSMRRKARAVNRFGSGIAKYSVPPLLSSATLPCAHSVIEPGIRKKSMVSSLPTDARLGAILEGDVSDVGCHADRRRRVFRPARLPGEIHAVVVEAQSGDRRRVPPAQVIALPGGMDQLAVEPAPVTDEISIDHLEPACGERFGQRAIGSEGIGIADASEGTVGRVAAYAGERRTTPVENEVAVQRAAGHWTIAIHAGG